jgi:hypothetical protein
LEQREARQGDSKRRVLKEKSFCCDNYSPFAATILSHFVLPPTHNSGGDGVGWPIHKSPAKLRIVCIAKHEYMTESVEYWSDGFEGHSGLKNTLIYLD